MIMYKILNGFINPYRLIQLLPDTKISKDVP